MPRFYRTRSSHLLLVNPPPDPATLAAQAAAVLGLPAVVMGQPLIDRRTGATVTLLALDNWQGLLEACVKDPSTPNPAGIPGLDNYWMKVTELQPTP